HCHRGRDRLRARLFDPAAVPFRQPAAGRHYVKRPHPNACARLRAAPAAALRMAALVGAATDGPHAAELSSYQIRSAHRHGRLPLSRRHAHLPRTRFRNPRRTLAFLLFQFAWNLHEGVTHSMVLTCAVAASLWALMRITENGRASDYLLFGLIVGI